MYCMSIWKITKGLRFICKSSVNSHKIMNVSNQFAEIHIYQEYS